MVARPVGPPRGRRRPLLGGGRAPDSGVVYRYGLRRIPGAIAFLELARLTEPDPAPGDHFGYSVAFDGDKVLAGAPDRDGAHPTRAPRTRSPTAARSRR